MMHAQTPRCCRQRRVLCALPLMSVALTLLLGSAGCQDRRLKQRMAENLQRGIAAQAEQFKQFRADPDRFVGAVWHKERILMIDAVGDCITTQRVGSMSDGGKWICNGFKLRDRCAVLAIGAGDNISFDEGMAREFGCQVHTMDPGPTVTRKLSHLAAGKAFGAGRMTFHPWALGPVSELPGEEMTLTIEGAACQVKRLDEMASALNLDRFEVLKMDIEGGEFAALKDILQRRLLEKFDVKLLLVEFHIRDGTTHKDLISLLDQLAQRGYFIYRKELNPHDAQRCAEFALARRDFFHD